MKLELLIKSSYKQRSYAIYLFSIILNLNIETIENFYKILSKINEKKIMNFYTSSMVPTAIVIYYISYINALIKYNYKNC